ncbi:MAG: sensor histidine kinase KdpD [Elusimicrobia bacterium]|nr:sensor histidine kinase KdpD [Elusimicrobiota bacterium]
MPKEAKRSPESFLAQAQKEEQRSRGGRLKVFLGAAPGVGKTFSMLEAARLKQRDGLSVLVGVAETHGRLETQALLEGLAVLPRRAVDHRGVKLSEFDLDAALARAPALILIDELAHSNAPGSKHAKRWQDVLELLERGIDVYSTLNVQHLESLNDVVAQITGISVRETVPDSVLERADVELVDLPPEELLERMRAGRVYIPEQAVRAVENFFRLSNLTALRELALRVTAEGVGAVLESYRSQQAPEAIWPTAQRIMVCVGPGPYSANLVRAARRIAGSAKAEWLAVFVQPSGRPLSESARLSAVENLRLAEQLGAETLSLTSRDVVEGILELARQRNVTKLIIGKSDRPRWREVIQGSLVDDLIRKSGDIEVDVLRGGPSQGSLASLLVEPSAPAPGKEYAVAVGAAAIATGICFGLFPILQLTNLVMVYLLGALIVATRGFRGPATLYSLLGVLCFDFFFVPPRFTMSVADTQYIFTFIVMFIASYLISHLTLRQKASMEEARHSELRTATLHALSRQLASTRGVEALLETAVRHLAKVFESEVMILLPGREGGLEVRATSAARSGLDEKERSVAQWVFDLGQPAGLGTQTLPVVDALYVPLVGGEATMGVLRVQPRSREDRLNPEQMLLLESLAHQLALALDVDRLQEDVRKSQLRAETERLRSSLLSSVSHDLRTPLAAIIGSASSLIQTAGNLAEKEASELLVNIRNEAHRLARLVHNLIETTRLESATVALKKEPHSIEEVVGSAIERLEPDLADRKLKTLIPEDLPLVPIDAVLIEQVFVNLIENALRHTPAKSPIELSARTADGSLVVELADRGPGIPPEDLERVFEKFYRTATPAGGAGLGLAICKAVITVHGGRITAENREGGGALFRFTLPLESGS